MDPLEPAPRCEPCSDDPPRHPECKGWTGFCRCACGLGGPRDPLRPPEQRQQGEP